MLTPRTTIIRTRSLHVKRTRIIFARTFSYNFLPSCKEDTRINFRLYTLVFFFLLLLFPFFSRERPRLDTPRYLSNDTFTPVSNIFPVTFPQWLLNWKSRNTRGSVYPFPRWNARVISSIIGLWWRAWILKFRIKAVKRGAV